MKPGAQIKAAWQYRHFIRNAIVAELRGKFARSRIGGLWLILHPLAMATIYAVVLSKVLGARLGGVDTPYAYAIYLIAGIAAWTLFSETVTRCLSVFIDYANVQKKIAFPRVALPSVVAGASMLNQIILVLVSIIIFWLLGVAPSPALLALPVPIIVTLLFGMGLGLFLSLFHIFNRDVGQVTGVVLGLWFWLTPIVYDAGILPESFAGVIAWNPMTSIVRAYQDILLYQQWPEFSTLLYPAGIAIVLLVLTLIGFRRAGADVVDAL